MLDIIAIRPGVSKIRYNDKTVGIVERIIKNGNVMYYCHFYGVSAVYNTKQDAISHLLWRSGMPIKDADIIARIEQI